MIAFNTWLADIEKEYPMYQDKDGYNIGNVRALEVGWKAALEWVHRNHCSGAFECGSDLENDIAEELGEE